MTKSDSTLLDAGNPQRTSELADVLRQQFMRKAFHYEKLVLSLSRIRPHLQRLHFALFLLALAGVQRIRHH
jgi:hypothetical protein